MQPTRILGLLLGAFALAACSDQTITSTAAPRAATLRDAVVGRGVEGRYIVVLKDGVDARGLAASVSAMPRAVYGATLNGFTAQLSRGQLSALLHHPAVDYIEQDQTTRAAATQVNPPWGLDRIDQRNLPLSAGYSYNVAGSGIRAYVIDSGIETSHPQFFGRAVNVYDAFGGNGQDCFGHGTHVAGIIAASLDYAAAKSAQPLGVRVLDCQGFGTVSDLITAVDWVRLNRLNPAVANISITAPLSSALNTAVNNLANSGVFVTVAAGDDNVSACNVSPASASAAITVAASDQADWRAPWSNYGGCVDIYAPGVDILSTWIGGTTATVGGTSQASAFAAGVGALYKGQFGQVSSATIHSWIVNNATLNYIKGNASGTPNRLLWKGVL